MSYRDSYSLYPRYHTYSASKGLRVGSHLRSSMMYGGSQPSVLSSISTYRSRALDGMTYSPTPDMNEVYPGLFVGDAVAAKDKAFLRRMGINYVLNTAEGKCYTQVDTDHIYYRDCPGLRYKGFQLIDHPSTDISKYFRIAANFIDEGISRGGRVLVHCLMGLSRSATCALAFLMIKRGMTLTEALALVRSRRDIHPNEGFIRQLQDLDRELRSSQRWPVYTEYWQKQRLKNTELVGDVFYDLPCLASIQQHGFHIGNHFDIPKNTAMTTCARMNLQTLALADQVERTAEC